MAFEKRLARAERQDAIYHEKLHPDPIPEREAPRKGIVDVPLLLITAALILFGIIFIVTMINLYVSKKKTHY